MKKFAFAAIALLGACLLVTVSHSDAKTGGGGSGFKSGFKGKFSAGRPFFRPNHSRAFAHNRFLHRRHNHGLVLLGAGGVISLPLAYGQPADQADVTGSISVPQRVAQPIIRSAQESQQACSAEYVTVPSGSGGENTVTVIRC
jgi:hypothetical protein